MKEFSCRTRVIAGSGAVAALKNMGAKRLLVVTDPYFMKNGTARRVAQAAGAEEFQIMDRVEPDPGVALAAEGTAKVREFGPDMVVALGGGSAIDCAKAMVYFSGMDVRLVAIPTTSGSGSEVTDFAILTHNGVKHPLIDEKIRPWAAILDDELLMQLPKGLIADSGFDVLCHAVEAYVARNAGAVTDALARQAFCDGFSALPRSYAGGQEVRLKMHLASTMAGMAFTQAGLGLCHAMAHSLGGLYHVPHGRLNAILLPAVITANVPGAAKKYAELSRAAGLGGSAEAMAARSLCNALVRLRNQLGLPGTLAAAGIDPRQVRRDREKILDAALKDPCCATNPVTVTAETAAGVLDQVTGRG